MAASLPSPPQTPNSGSGSATPPSRLSTPHDALSTVSLAERLDTLLEQYLDLVAQYTALREELSAQFSAGFFSLAQAQRNAASTLGSGRRFGRERWDERMKAQRRVRVGEEGKVEVVRQTKQQDEKEKENAGSGEEKGNEMAEKKKEKQDPAFRDPITWYGILVPQALRQTQTQFVRAVKGSVPSLVEVDREMRALEEEIWHVRDEMGILGDYEHQREGVGRETKDQDGEVGLEEKQWDQEMASASTRNSKTRSLVSRPAHSSSRVL